MTILPPVEGKIPGWQSGQAHNADERYTVRDGINLARYAMKLSAFPDGAEETGSALRTAVLETLGEEALRYVPRL